MKVLRITLSLDPVQGGVAQAVRSTVSRLREANADCEVLTLDAPDAAFIKNDSFKVHALGPASTPWKYSKALLPWLTNNLSSYDAVIIDGLWTYCSHATIKAIKILRSKNKGRIPKVFVMPHGMLDPYFQRDPSRRLKAIRNWVYWKLFEAEVINDADGLLFTCEQELLLAREPFKPYHPKKEYNVGLGIEEPPVKSQAMIDEFHSHCSQLKGQSYFLFISRIHEKKGVDILVKAYARTRQNNSPKLVIAGPGLETPYGQQIEQEVRALGLENEIFFPGMLQGTLKWGAFYGSVAFCLPSHQENFGIAVVEGLACSLPVIISDQVNIWREIKDNGGGIVSADSSDEYAKSFERWNTMTDAQRAEMGRGARASFEKHFSIIPAAKKMAAVLKQ
ncbi:MAG: glycosyltransferase [Chryseolinea sp.]